MSFKLSRERLLLSGLLLAAGGGLYFDRLSTAQASPAAEEVAIPVVTAVAGAVPNAPLVRRPEALLAARLDELAGPAGEGAGKLRDVFSRVDSATAPTAAPALALPDRWKRRTLSAVILRPDGKGIAVIEGQMVRAGGWFDGMQLIRLSKEAAVFSDGTRQVTVISMK